MARKAKKPKARIISKTPCSLKLSAFEVLVLKEVLTFYSGDAYKAGIHKLQSKLTQAFKEREI